MSDKKSDVFTELGYAVLDARHNGTPPEQAEASRLTLLGQLAPLPPYVALMTETPWAQVAQVAISPEGKIAVLGIEPDGTKEIIEWTVISGRWTSRVVDSTGAEMRVDHLHYPQDSEDVAFSVTRLDGKTRVFWGDWKFDANTDELGKVVDIYGYLLDGGTHQWPHCVVTYESGGKQYILKFQKGGGGRNYATDQLIEQVMAKELKVLGRRPTGEIIILATYTKSEQSIILLDLEKVQDWHSDQYDEILADSVMERDGQISFVALVPHQRTCKEMLFVTPSSEKMVGIVTDPKQIHCLPSGRILTWEPMVGNWIHDVHSDNRIDLPGVKEIGDIVEIPSGLVIHQTASDGKHDLRFIKERGSNPGEFGFFTAKKIANLRCWDDHLVFQVGGQLEIICAQADNWAYDHTADKQYPLYTSFNRLVPTNEGILGWHFVNGTFTIIRYPLSE